MTDEFWIQTYKGGRFDLHDFAKTEGFTPRSIAHAMCNIPRFGGHTSMRWTVAHHTIGVEWLVKQLAQEDDFPLIRPYALLHDAAEVITGDIPTPVKAYMKTFHNFDFARVVERPILQDIYRCFDLPLPSVATLDLIAEADRYALKFERQRYMASDRHWKIDDVRIPKGIEWKVNANIQLPSLRRILTDNITDSLREYHALKPTF